MSFFTPSKSPPPLSSPELLKWTLKEWIAHTRIRLQLGNAGPIRKARMEKEIEELEKRVQALELEEVLTK